MSVEDVVGVFDEDGGKQLFENARSMQLQVTRSTKTMQHPLETGVTVVDHRIQLPIEATLIVVLTSEHYASGYSELAAAFGAASLLTVRCKASSFASMYISEMPHEESPDQIDAITIMLRLTEAQFYKSQATAAPYRPSRGKSSRTTQRGEQAPRESVAHQGWGSIKSLFGGS